MGRVRYAKSNIINTLQMFAGNYRDSTEKSECRDFKFMGIACIPAIPVFLKSPQPDFHCIKGWFDEFETWLNIMMAIVQKV